MNYHLRWQRVAGSALGFALLVSSFAGCTRRVRKGPPVFIPAPPVEPRLQALLAFSAEKDLRPAGRLSSAVFGKKRSHGRGFLKPYGVAIFDGKLYATDTVLNKVLVVDLKTGVFRTLKGDAQAGKVRSPINLVHDSAGNLYVADTRRRQVLVYDAKERYVRAFGDGKYKPSGLAVRGDELYVSDLAGHKVLVLDRKTGKVLRRFGGPGTKKGQTAFPTNIAIDNEGSVYVSESLTGRVEKFDGKTGELQTQFGRLGRRPGELVRPKGVAVDRDGNLYIVDAATEMVQIFNKKKQLLLFFGGRGDKLGSLYLPAGLTISYDAKALAAMNRYASDAFSVKYLLVAVSQYGRHRITIYGFGKKK